VPLTHLATRDLTLVPGGGGFAASWDSNSSIAAARGGQLLQPETAYHSGGFYSARRVAQSSHTPPHEITQGNRNSKEYFHESQDLRDVADFGTGCDLFGAGR
jgi:hypothetical protein